MPSTLYRPRHQQVASVVDLDSARVRLRGPLPTQQRTLLIRCATWHADEEIIRHIGVDSDSTLEEIQRVIDIAFALPADASAPSRFTRNDDDSGRLDAATAIADYVSEPGDVLYFHWGLWQFSLMLADVYPRDAATPRALCVAGAGEFGGAPFDIAEINTQLLGPSTVQSVEAAARPEVVDVVNRSRRMDFLPLLQALDLARPVEVAPAVAEILATLPRERTDRARDAFWCTVLALSCLVDDHTTNSVLESSMEALGWSRADGEPLSAGEVHQLCAGSLVRLASVGGFGSGASAVDKLDLYRALLRRVR